MQTALNRIVHEFSITGEASHADLTRAWLIMNGTCERELFVDKCCMLSPNIKAQLTCEEHAAKVHAYSVTQECRHHHWSSDVWCELISKCAPAECHDIRRFGDGSRHWAEKKECLYFTMLIQALEHSFPEFYRTMGGHALILFVFADATKKRLADACHHCLESLDIKPSHHNVKKLRHTVRKFRESLDCNAEVYLYQFKQIMLKAQFQAPDPLKSPLVLIKRAHAAPAEEAEYLHEASVHGLPRGVLDMPEDVITKNFAAKVHAPANFTLEELRFLFMISRLRNARENFVMFYGTDKLLLDSLLSWCDMQERQTSSVHEVNEVEILHIARLFRLIFLSPRVDAHYHTQKKNIRAFAGAVYREYYGTDIPYNVSVSDLAWLWTMSNLSHGHRVALEKYFAPSTRDECDFLCGFRERTEVTHRMLADIRTLYL
jgi:hypothetical protein